MTTPIDNSNPVAELRKQLLPQVDDLLMDVTVPVFRAMANGVDATTLAAAGTEKVTNFIVALIEQYRANEREAVLDELKTLCPEARSGLFNHADCDWHRAIQSLRTKPTKEQ